MPRHPRCLTLSHLDTFESKKHQIPFIFIKNINKLPSSAYQSNSSPDCKRQLQRRHVKPGNCLHWLKTDHQTFSIVWTANYLTNGVHRVSSWSPRVCLLPFRSRSIWLSLKTQPAIGEWREINYTCSICFNTAGHINKNPRFGVIIKRRARARLGAECDVVPFAGAEIFQCAFFRFSFFARQHTHPVTFLSCLNNKKHKRSEWSPLHQMWNYFHWVKKRCETRNREFGGVRGWHHIRRGFPAMFSVCQEKKRNSVRASIIKYIPW